MSKDTPFAACEEHLAQGDIFCLRLVAPYADDEVRIFRTKSGMHGSQVFENRENSGQVFSYDDLISALEGLSPNQRLYPFYRNNDGQDEMVVVYADLLNYFIIASQTCDISGVDSTPKPFAAILPFITLGSYVIKEKLPIALNEEESDDYAKWTSIVEYLENKLGFKLANLGNDPKSLSIRIREIIANWKPLKNSLDNKIRAQISNCLNNAVSNKKTYTYYLPSSTNVNIPEGFIDFCRLYTIPTKVLSKFKQYRIATIEPPYREQFAEKLGLYLSRIATLVPLVPPQF